MMARRRAVLCGRRGRASPSLGCCSSSCGRSGPRPRESAAFRGPAGQDVVTVRSEAHAWNDEAPLGQRRVHAQRVVVAVQIIDGLSDGFALEVLPRPVADAVSRVDRRLAVSGLGAEVGAPRLASRTVALRQLLAKLISAFETAEVGALARSRAVTKNVMFGDCGSSGAAGCAGGCCASTPDVTPVDASTSAAKINILGLFIAALSLGFSECRIARMVAIFCNARKPG